MDIQEKYILELDKVNVTYDSNIQAVKDFSVSILPNQITSLIGSEGSGKTSLLRSINRLNELYSNIETTGTILLNGEDIMKKDAVNIRLVIGMVFKHPNPFPHLDIYNNVISGYKINKIKLSKSEKEAIVEESLTYVGLWDDVKNKLKANPLTLTQGEQQRLCIARSIALKPTILLMDEPTHLLDSTCTNRVENLMVQLKNRCTIIVVTNNLSQAARISDYTIYMENGELVEYGATAKLFWNPDKKETEEYITSHT